MLVNILGFAVHTVFVATTQLCTKAAIGNKEIHECDLYDCPIKLHI